MKTCQAFVWVLARAQEFEAEAVQQGVRLQKAA